MDSAEQTDRHLGLVTGEARRLSRRLGGRFASQELMGSGCVGLMAAARLFDSDRGTGFSSFARMKIRAAMLDELREMDVLPRRARTALRSLERTRAHLMATQRHEPTRSQLAEARHLREEQVEGLQVLGVMARHEPVDAAAGLSSALPDPSEQLAARQRLGQLAQAIHLMPARLQAVLHGYYQQELTFREIGVRLGVTESRVSQLHSQAVRDLRTALC